MGDCNRRYFFLKHFIRQLANRYYIVKVQLLLPFNTAYLLKLSL
ncbi:MAG: hypothetical protein JWR61_361 [Ferruginibacter sp.]|nr:hypothetical protein [Ferruginibacter sp.]